MFTPTLCDASQTHRTGNHTTIHHTEMFMRSSTVVTEIKYHRIKTMANTCRKQSCIRSIYAYTLYHLFVMCPRFMRWYFLLCICRGIKQTYIYVGDICIYLLMCIMVCSWVTLLTSHGCHLKHKQSNICLFLPPETLWCNTHD